MQQQYNVRRSDLSCDDANRYAFQTVGSLGYRVTQFEPAQIGRDGIIKGSGGETNGDGKAGHAGVVTIRCAPNEVVLSAAEDRFLSQDLNFTRGFYLAFTGIADHAAASTAYAEERSGGATEGGVKFKIQPQLGLESKLDFGEDLAAGGVLAVRVTIQNGSDRTYRLDPDSIELRPAEGTAKVRQLAVPEASAAVARAATAQAPQGAPPTDSARVQALLRERALQPGTLRPGQQVDGFLYFPTGRYARARATLVDVATSESEGFLVEF